MDSSMQLSPSGAESLKLSQPGPSKMRSMSLDTCIDSNVSFLQSDVTVKQDPSTSGIQSDLSQKRRSSTRSIKRKKFDDEVVESSLIKTERVVKAKLEGKFNQETPVVPHTPVSSIKTDKVEVATPPQPTEKKKNTKSTIKRNKKSKNTPTAASTKDLGRWKPQDDLLLISAVQQTNDLTSVYLGVKFSCKFTLKEVQERWYALLYDPVLSKLATSVIQQLHPDIVSAVNSKALYSKREEEILGTIVSTSQPTLKTFEQLLQVHPTDFHRGRTPRVLYNHWLLMKQYHLLPDQTVKPMPRGDHVNNFSDAEELNKDDLLTDDKDENLSQELLLADRRHKKEIRHLEQELPKWQVLVDNVTGISTPDFDHQTLAVLRGRLVRYLMRSREITLGRATKDNPIDVDLSLEGPAWKISRRQGVIKLRNNADFYIANEGKRPIYIEGKPLLTGNKQKLNNNTVIEISCLRFIFLINMDFFSAIRTEAQKLAT